MCETPILIFTMIVVVVGLIVGIRNIVKEFKEREQ